MKNKIFLAIDTTNISKVKKIIEATNTNKIDVIPKFGLQFFYSKNGRKFLEKFKKPFFLDVKIADVPNTALSALETYLIIKS